MDDKKINMTLFFSLSLMVLLDDRENVVKLVR